MRRALDRIRGRIRWQRLLGPVVSAFAMTATSVGAQVQPVNLYEINPIHSQIEFTVPFMGLTHVKGSFEDYRGSLLLDEQHVTRSFVAVVIDATSIHTGNATRDKHLASDDFLDVRRFPSVVFLSDRVESAPEGFLMHGRLTMHGVTRLITIAMRQRHAVRHDADIDYAGFDGAVVLSWRDFAIRATNTRNAWFDPARMLVDDSVRVTLSVEAVRRRPRASSYPTLAAAMAFLDSTSISAVAARYDAAKSIDADSAARVARPFVDMASILLDAGRTRDALELLQLNANARPDDADALAALAFGQLRGGAKAAAVASYRRAIAVDSLQPQALVMLRWLQP